MIDRFILRNMMPIIHATVYIFTADGHLEEELEDTDGEEVSLYKKIIKEASKEYPYIMVDNDGVACCVMWCEREQQYVALGRVGIYGNVEVKGKKILYCSKDTYTSVVLMIWNMLTSEQIGSSDLWFRNIKIDKPLAEIMTKNLFMYHEEGRSHNPYAQELREHDSIRRGDLQALKESIEEVYTGALGQLSSDPVRNCKNLAICVISCAARCAIEGGLNPEMAFAMSDTYIRYIEDELNDPLKIEKVTREAEFDYAREVKELKQHNGNNPIILQVKDYVFKHIHDAILIRDIAKYIGVSPNYLSEQFSQYEGITLKQYILDEKIKSSEYLLKYTDYSLQEISSFCAFSSQSRFSVYFQRKNGITPAKYRKKFRKSRNE